MNEPLNIEQVLEPCAVCGTPGVRTVYKDKLFGKGARAVIIENLPLRQCASCGESYYEPETSLLIDDILAHPGKHAVSRQVSVVSLAA
ncbi:MAG: YgiT-type zinc finger protein [Acidobacteria bacterium]|nr:YgiT-type zinc finger protein [Acidobacteriota bacterium]MBI3425601.1 YgiT-type zinc finger protein [Acidobacteriota bacterium]